MIGTVIAAEMMESFIFTGDEKEVNGKLDLIRAYIQGSKYCEYLKQWRE